MASRTCGFCTPPWSQNPAHFTYNSDAACRSRPVEAASQGDRVDDGRLARDAREPNAVNFPTRPHLMQMTWSKRLLGVGFDGSCGPPAGDASGSVSATGRYVARSADNLQMERTRTPGKKAHSFCKSATSPV
jgi:hypothetical protein